MRLRHKQVKHSLVLRIGIGIAAILILSSVYIFQRINVFLLILNLFSLELSSFPSYTSFVFNKTLRLALNDLACFMVIWSIFQERKHVRLAWFVFLLEILVILPLYLFIKLSVEGDTEISSPLLSQIHRMVVNPTLMLLLILGMLYQKMGKDNR